MIASTAIPIQNLVLAPGSCITAADVSWEQYEAISAELGNRARLTYYDGLLEIMSPLPIHERPHRIIGYIVTTLLDAENRDWEDFGSTTFRRFPNAGLEPDTCFYIQNAAAVRDCERMNLEVYPPADLAIESDVTSQTTFSAYAQIGVPEVWRYKSGRLQIFLLQAGEYIESGNSPTFLNLPVSTLIPKLVEQALQTGSSQMLRNLRRLTQHGLSDSSWLEQIQQS
ncbi:MAG: Uma2 family endonuclease [Pegethrix bostrychoides GSE-TBD4-15B]|uniref:Uma2 family endonuclease n=1 Tax=Pegethrix bostrychoides GSE-TBD4-15B TaxID=2839662 RepID=A0A951P9R6_9CYAN|nr:Uma2 family endonuclease [Pegethrix bostrychoides GSE-TBD4-15B]